ncbi:Retrovirus-related Pol polyprotein [Thelohanellus kitauei]|uniref:Retrovirus-related Pol polyprotein n=1 Tax=Thelohanellus kitauei TaxID=669202 RepID=A0A0C2JKQ7_THEKT|nr:Retrovirus-related Pol polyprotein [Thelohanellus kitauei]
MPISVHTDMGMQFQSSLFKEVLNKLGICKTNTSPYHPQSDGLVERFNRTLINSLSKCSNKDEEWDLYLQSVTFSYNISKNETTGYAPFELLFKRTPYLLIDHELSTPLQNFSPWPDKIAKQVLSDVVRASNTAQICQAKQYNKRNSNIQWKMGDYVYLFVPIDGSKCTNKLSKLWRGPYQIIDLKLPLIQIERDNTIQWVHANRCKKCPSRIEDKPSIINESKEKNDEPELPENIDEKPPLWSSDSENESIGDGNSVYPSEPSRYNL